MQRHMIFEFVEVRGGSKKMVKVCAKMKTDEGESIFGLAVSGGSGNFFRRLSHFTGENDK